VNDEPVLTASGITAAIVAVINVLVVFNIFQATAEQLAQLNIAIALLVGIGLGIWARMRVTPVSDPTLVSGTTVNVTDAKGAATGSTVI
jgi:predicted ABC-type sugar transport system permease subunit